MHEDPAIVARLRDAGCVFAEEEARLLRAAARTADDLDGMVRRRAAGLPLEQIVGWAEFCGLRIHVDPGVFVPRPRSEFLVETAVALADSSDIPEISDSGGRGARRRGDLTPGRTGPAPTGNYPGRAGTGPATARNGLTGAGTGPAHARAGTQRTRHVIVDLCCGTGALGIAVAAKLGAGELHGVDVDPAAVACARRNVEPAGGRVHSGDLFSPLPSELRGRVTTLLCNAPYVPTGEIALLPAEAREHEHRVALDGGDDGLAVLRRAAAGGPGWLAPGGHLLVETSGRQADAMAAVMAAAGLGAAVHECQDYGSAVVVGGVAS